MININIIEFIGFLPLKCLKIILVEISGLKYLSDSSGCLQRLTNHAPDPKKRVHPLLSEKCYA